MAKHSTAAFLAGEVIGAAIVYLFCTEKGKKTLQEGISWVGAKIDEAQRQAEETPQQEEETEE